jgi:hypothetical protein
VRRCSASRCSTRLTPRRPGAGGVAPAAHCSALVVHLFAAPPRRTSTTSVVPSSRSTRTGRLRAAIAFVGLQHTVMGCRAEARARAVGLALLHAAFVARRCRGAVAVLARRASRPHLEEQRCGAALDEGSDSLRRGWPRRPDARRPDRDRVARVPHPLTGIRGPPSPCSSAASGSTRPAGPGCCTRCSTSRSGCPGCSRTC